MNILMVHPQYPDTYWGFKHALKFIAKKAAIMPLGLITIAPLLPKEWNKKFIDLNVSKLHDHDLAWADFLFISAMSIQTASVNQIIERAGQFKIKIVAGGPLFTEEPEQFPQIDHLVLNEAEITLPQFLEDLANGCPKKIYRSDLFADIMLSPIPDYSLIKHNKYVSAGIQYSRGCPFDCEFCDITALFGHKVRTKTAGQIIQELEALYGIGWRGAVFFVDDNFIGNKKALKNDLLPVLIEWMKSKNNPFIFTTEASIDLSDDDELMQMMVAAGFTTVFVGIETPDEVNLTECNKIQNKKRDLVDCVHVIQKSGIEVFAGFIVGFDNDPSNIFQRQINFIQQSGIITAMVGLLNAPRLSKLYKRLNKEGRILHETSGDNTDYSMNFVPMMNKEQLITGYKKIIHDIYSSKSYYSRVISFLKHYNPPPNGQRAIKLNLIVAFIKSIFIMGILKKNRRYYWNLLFWSIFNKPETFVLAVTYSIYGYHFRKVYKTIT